MSSTIDGLFSANTTVQNPGTGKSVLGKDDFMHLMLAQLKYQDPMNPMESDEYAAQLAQFSSLEQLENLNNSMTTSIEANYQLASSVNNTMASNFIGKDVKLTSTTIGYKGQEEIQLGYDLAGQSSKTTISIMDENGDVIKTIENLSTKTGYHKLSWDFTDNAGKKVEEGSYRFKVDSPGYNDEVIYNDAFIVGSIKSIKFTSDGTKVLIEGQEYNLSEVVEIMDPDITGDNEDG
ncbi:MAG: flagellar hook capping protein [Melioribacteraceae bacterium]|nr:flagellar hook capping protein [Melioribacteraceae bacterium]